MYDKQISSVPVFGVADMLECIMKHYLLNSLVSILLSRIFSRFPCYFLTYKKMCDFYKHAISLSMLCLEINLQTKIRNLNCEFVEVIQFFSTNKTIIKNKPDWVKIWNIENNQSYTHRQFFFLKNILKCQGHISIKS